MPGSITGMNSSQRLILMADPVRRSPTARSVSPLMKSGERCVPEQLLGDFSFAIWHKRKQRIYCARDPIGIKPFFYYFDGKTFRWASEPKPIFDDPAIPKEPNLTLICLYLLNRFDEREETLYKNIYRLPSSHFMVLEDGQLRKSQYWDVDPNYAVEI